MDTAFVISTFPSNRKQVEILNKCIDIIKSKNYDIILVSHMHLDSEIISKVRYYIYDSDNTFLPSEYTPFFFYRTGNLQFNIYNAGHTLPICRNMKNGIGMANLLGYETFIFMESDCIFSDGDFKRLEEIIEYIIEHGEKMIFFKPKNYRGPDGRYVYETLLFGGYSKYFMDTFTPPTNLKEWFDMKMGYTLEDTFYTKFQKEDRTLDESYFIINSHSSEYFSSSEINLSRYGLLNVEMIHNDVIHDEPVLFINNALIEKCTKYVQVWVKKKHETDWLLIENLMLANNSAWYKSYRYDDSEIQVEVYDDENMQYHNLTKRFKMNMQNLETFKRKGVVSIIN